MDLCRQCRSRLDANIAASDQSASVIPYAITKTRLYKYIESLQPKQEHVQIKTISFHIPAQNIDCGYSLEPPQCRNSNDYPQSICLAK